jgi:hypothetical protein
MAPNINLTTEVKNTAISARLDSQEIVKLAPEIAKGAAAIGAAVPFTAIVKRIWALPQMSRRKCGGILPRLGSRWLICGPHEPIRPRVGDMVTGFLHHTVRPKTAKVNARPPGEQESGSRRRHQYPVHRIAKVPKLHLRVVVGSRWKRKQQDPADVKENAEKKLRPYGVPLFGAVGPKHRDEGQPSRGYDCLYSGTQAKGKDRISS